MTLRATPLLVILVVGNASVGGCTPTGELRRSTEEASNVQLEAARRSGFATEIVAEDAPLDAEELLSRHGNLDSEVTYLVLTRTDAQVVWGGALRDEPPVPEVAILGTWVAPYLRFDDTDTALKGFVFGYLGALHSTGRINWDSAIVPFRPPEESGPAIQNTYHWGSFLALLMLLLTIWSVRQPR